MADIFMIRGLKAEEVLGYIRLHLRLCHNCRKEHPFRTLCKENQCGHVSVARTHRHRHQVGLMVPDTCVEATC